MILSWFVNFEPFRSYTIFWIGPFFWENFGNSMGNFWFNIELEKWLLFVMLSIRIEVLTVFFKFRIMWMSSQIVKLIHLILGWNNAIIWNQSFELRIEFIDHIYSMSLSHFFVHCGKCFPDWEQKSNQHTNFQMKTNNKLR